MLCLALIFLAGCGGVYADALERGDAFAAAGRWDDAAAAYERAVRAAPSEPEAAARLASARKSQAALRVAWSRWYVQQGAHASALAAAADAVRLAPGDAAPRHALAAAAAAAATQGDALLAAGRSREALELALALRAAVPTDAAGPRIEAAARDDLAARACADGEAHLAAGRRAAAAVAFAEAERVRPGFRDAAERSRQLRAAVEDELRFVAVVQRGATVGREADVASAAESRVLAIPHDDSRPLLTVDGRRPADGAVGVVLGLALHDYAATHDVRNERRRCSYVCGVDRTPNPDVAAAKARVGATERQRDEAGHAASRAERDEGRRRDELARANVAAEQAERARRRADEELEGCRRRSGAGPAGGACDAEQKAAREAELAQESARGRVEAARAAAAGAEDRLGERRRAAQDASRALDEAIEALRRTPTILVTERRCDFDYPVEHHTARAAAWLTLRVTQLGAAAPTELAPSRFEVAAVDDAFDAVADRCSEVAGGDPLRLPDESSLRRDLAVRVAEGVAGSIRGAYDAYRADLEAEMRRQRARGDSAAEQDARARWLLTRGGGARELGLL